MAHPSSPSTSTMKEQLQASASQLWSSMKSLEQTMKRPVSPDSATNDEVEGVQASLESVIRVMFGSCTTGAVTPSASPTSGSPNIQGSPASKSRSTCEPVSPTRNQESLYTKIFSDNQLRAEEAVCHLREQLEGMRESRSPSRRLANHSGMDVPCLFPVSSPKQRGITLGTDPPHPPPPHPASINNVLASNVTFDDGVSTISQDTLEQMARVYQGENEFMHRVHSDLTQDPVDTSDESWMHTVNPNAGVSPFRQGQRISSPLRFTRQGRSHCTISTKQSRQTMGTKSTMSTQTQDFASAFGKDEQKYWQDVVKEQDEREDPMEGSIGISSRHEKLIRARELRRIRELKARRDGTITTANSSLYSVQRAQEKAFNATRADPDRLMEVLIMPPGTEMAEI